MVQTNELRVGSLVQDKHGKIVTVESIDSNGINIECGFCGGSHDYFEDAIFGVPLTPEILLSVLFYEQNNGNYFTLDVNDQFSLHFNLKDTIFDKKGIQISVIDGMSGFSGIKTEFTYVHQLQSLYYALTGTELNIQL